MLFSLSKERVPHPYVYHVPYRKHYTPSLLPDFDLLIVASLSYLFTSVYFVSLVTLLKYFSIQNSFPTLRVYSTYKQSSVSLFTLYDAVLE